MIIGEDKLVIARKSHACTLCGKEIVKGECYRKYSVIDSGTWYRNKEHEHCHHVASEYDLYDEGVVDMDYYLKLYDEEAKEKA